MLRAAFLVDDAPQAGLGHVMRSINLAVELASMGTEVYFFNSSDGVVPEVVGERFPKIRLPESDSVEKMGQAACNICKKMEVDILLIDTYKVNRAFFDVLAESGALLAYIDDLNAFAYPVHFLINGNITGDDYRYEPGEPNEIFLTGLEYNLIRSEFRDIAPRTIRQVVKDIMITTGGTDPLDVVPEFCEEVLRNDDFQDIRVHVIVGGRFQNKAELKALEQRDKRIILYENVQFISKVMLQADIAVSSSGSTLYELAACGTPTIGFVIAENQLAIAEKMGNKGYIENFGWLDRSKISTLTECISKLACDVGRRTEMSARTQSMVDGKGANRVARMILDRATKKD